MSKRFAFVMLVAWSGVSFAFADTIQLKDKAAITGRILARKHDQVFVDVGYTVLVAPRNQIEKITESDSSGHIDKRTPTAVATNQSAIKGLSSPPPSRCLNVPSVSWSANWAQPWSRCALPADWVPASSSTRKVTSSRIFTSSKTKHKSRLRCIIRKAVNSNAKVTSTSKLSRSTNSPTWLC